MWRSGAAGRSGKKREEAERRGQVGEGGGGGVLGDGAGSRQLTATENVSEGQQPAPIHNRFYHVKRVLNMQEREIRETWESRKAWERLPSPEPCHLTGRMSQ